ncbi:MAG: shikimate dehydrogenase [Actinomycetota bacterium]|nr:shikimate dehydrogenase [Acidimicrobiales bacterium]MEE2806180.1 shikimate dehydrogenase [Actinomycetota bacterium]
MTTNDMPTGITRIAAVIGDPVRHSLSPRLHNAGFAALGLDWFYVACPVAKGQAAQAIEAMRTLGIEGLSVTMPHKKSVAVAVDDLSPTAAKLGAVNCVRRDGDRLVGENTDGIGFVDSLRSQLQMDPDGLTIVIVGAGGAARSIALAMAEHGARVGIFNRTATSAEEVVEIVGAASSVVQEEAIREADVIVNATPLGMSNDSLPFDPTLLSKGQSLIDLIYEPEKTALLLEAESLGVKTLNGVGMLLHQAGAQFQLWTGCEPPLREMAQAVGLTLLDG